MGVVGCIILILIRLDVSPANPRTDSINFEPSDNISVSRIDFFGGRYLGVSSLRVGAFSVSSCGVSSLRVSSTDVWSTGLSCGSTTGSALYGRGS